MSVGEARAQREALHALGIPEDAAARLTLYLDKLAEWSARVNLSGARSAAERVAVLVEPVVAVARDVSGGTALDVGSGNGSPGLVLALLRPDVEVTLLEPRVKRWAFLREAARLTAAARVHVVRQRLETYEGDAVDTVTVRALRVALRDLRRLVKAGGDVIVFGNAPPHDAGFEAIARPAAWPGDVHRFRRAP